MFVGAVGVARGAPGIRRCGPPFLIAACADAAVACEQRRVLIGGACSTGPECDAAFQVLQRAAASMSKMQNEHFLQQFDHKAGGVLASVLHYASKQMRAHSQPKNLFPPVHVHREC